MKIYRNNTLYVQKEDIEFVCRIRKNKFIRDFINERGLTFNNDNKYDFIKCKNEKEVDFFEKQKYILDYDSFSNLSINDLLDVSDNINSQYEKIEDDYNNLSTNDLKEYGNYIETELIKLEAEYSSIEDLINLKYGKVKFNIPGEDSKISRKKKIKMLTKKSRN